mmetsp:Transcript_16018/g.39003  ORF Transcript_16018/g.39003 Transcript_16018/m.39003 type:complete len:203 (+) Transcript_16018:4872-5480(+)
MEPERVSAGDGWISVERKLQLGHAADDRSAVERGGGLDSGWGGAKHLRAAHHRGRHPPILGKLRIQRARHSEPACCGMTVTPARGERRIGWESSPRHRHHRRSARRWAVIWRHCDDLRRGVARVRRGRGGHGGRDERHEIGGVQHGSHGLGGEIRSDATEAPGCAGRGGADSPDLNLDYACGGGGGSPGERIQKAAIRGSVR